MPEQMGGGINSSQLCVCYWCQVIDEPLGLSKWRSRALIPLYYWQLLAARRKLPMDEFNEMLKCSKLKTRAIFYVFYPPGISLDVPPLGLTIFSVLTRNILKVNRTIELPFSISSAIPTTWVIFCVPILLVG